MLLVHYCIRLRGSFVLAPALFIAFLVANSGTYAMRQQAVGAKGRLTCGGRPASNVQAGGVQVKLFDKDTGPDPDDQLDSGYTDANGMFELKGDTRELTNIDPEIRIFHECNKGINPCPIKWVLEIPDKYIFAGPPSNIKKVFNLGDVNLEVELEGQSHDCIH